MQYIKDRIIFICGGGALVLQLLLWILVFWKIRPSDVPFTLHYNVYRGADLIGEYKDLYKIPLFGLFFLVCNFFLGAYFYRREKVLSYIFFVLAFSIEAALGIALVALIRLNY